MGNKTFYIFSPLRAEPASDTQICVVLLQLYGSTDVENVSHNIGEEAPEHHEDEDHPFKNVYFTTERSNYETQDNMRNSNRNLLSMDTIQVKPQRYPARVSLKQNRRLM